MSRTVAILGGTHGNETNGVFVVDSYKTNPAPVQRPSFKDVLLVTTNTAVSPSVNCAITLRSRMFMRLSVPKH